MAYDRADRFPKLVTGTPCDVGPGTYDISDSPEVFRNLSNLYPFSSGTQRTSSCVSKHAGKLPGPGCYNIREPQRHIPERVSIDFTEERFKEQVHEGPGPGDYDIDSNIGDTKCGRKSDHPGTWKGSQGKLWLATPPRSFATSGVSVPSKHETNGYTFDKNGRLVKNQPKQQEPTFFYDVPREEMNTTTRMYKGNFWSRMSGRQSTPISDTPGPGEYEHEIKKDPSQVQCEKMREAKRASSRQSRYLDILYRTKMRENLPAPNAYDASMSSFNKYKKPTCESRRNLIEPPPFGSGAQRFDRSAHYHTPGPGTYEVSARQSCPSSIYGAPFGSTSSRLRKTPDKRGPAPSDHHTDVGSLAYESAKRFKSEWPRSQVTQSRTKISADKSLDIPFYYYDKREVQKSNAYHAAFKSRTPRFQPPRQTEQTDPGAYDVAYAFKVNRDRCDFHSRRIAPAFASRADRFPKVPKGIDVNVPGSTRYNLSGDIGSNVKGGVISHSRRKREQGPSGPGPAHYNISSSMSSSVLKKSFNITLGQRQPPTLVLRPSKVQTKRKRPTKQPAAQDYPDYSFDFEGSGSGSDYSAKYHYAREEREPSPEYQFAPNVQSVQNIQIAQNSTGDYRQDVCTNYRNRESAVRLVAPLNICRAYVTS